MSGQVERLVRLCDFIASCIPLAELLEAALADHRDLGECLGFIGPSTAAYALVFAFLTPSVLALFEAAVGWGVGVGTVGTVKTELDATDQVPADEGWEACAVLATMYFALHRNTSISAIELVCIRLNCG